MSQSRQLAAIMFTDIVGYTTLMGEDEQAAFELLKKNRRVQRPIIERYNGRWIKEIGDGVLASFSTVSDAVYCAKEIQETCLKENDLKLRIGIHLGEVVFEGNDVFGDGVNIASRLEPLAPIGGILVSESVNRNLGNKKGIETKYVRDETLKNVKDPIKIYAVKVEGAETPEPTTTRVVDTDESKSISFKKMGLPSLAIIVALVLAFFFYFRQGEDETQPTQPVVIDKSIAVIPFVDMSPEGDHEYFSDGISEELLNALVRIPGLKVVGRTSSWTYKGVTNKDLKAIGKELGVETVLEGSVRKSGNNVRITAQLVSAKDGFNLWSNTYDREFTDIFAIQDEITAAIVDAMSVHLIDEAVSLKPTVTANIDAYTIYLQARQKLASRSIENLIEARRLFEEAIRLDPDYDPAYSGLGRAISLFPFYSREFSGREVVGPAKDAATKAIDLNSQNSEAFSVLGYVATFHEWDWKTGEEAFKKSVELSHDDAEIFNFIGDYYRVVQHPTLAIEMESRALELDPLNPVNHSDLSRAYALIGDWENALRYVKSAQDLGFNFEGNAELLLRSYINLGRLEEAENTVAGLYDNNIKHFTNLYYKTIIAIAKEEYDIALSYIELMINTVEKPIYFSSAIGRFYLDLGMLDEAAYWLEKAYDNRELRHVFPIRSSSFRLPEDLPNHPALQSALDKPELNALIEIRRKNLGFTNKSP